MLSENVVKGLITEIHCQEDFTRWGILLSQPIVNDSRYDFLADIEGKIYRIQCKTAKRSNEKENSFYIPVGNKNWNNGKYKSYHGEIDYFYTYYNNIGYLIPIEKVGNRVITLRIKKQSSNNSKNDEKINWAQDFIFDNILEKLGANKIKMSKYKIKKKYCVDCGCEISRKAIRCKQCSKKFIKKRSVNKPIREELKKMIRNMSFTKIGNIYDVSDNAVRKWCDTYNLPRHKSEINKYSNEEWRSI